MPTQATVTGVLQAVEQGDREALGTLFDLVYEELDLLAHLQRRSWHGDLTLTTTGLVHELYLKIVDQKAIAASGRAHFFGVAAKAMRHILCNHARDRRRQKRGGGVEHFFGGMDVEDTAISLGISPRTVKRDWMFARAWLRRAMQLEAEG